MVFYGRCMLVTGWLAWATWWQKRRSVVRMTLGWTPRSDTQSGGPWSSRTTKETGHYAQQLGREWKQVYLSSPYFLWNLKLKRELGLLANWRMKSTFNLTFIQAFRAFPAGLDIRVSEESLGLQDISKCSTKIFALEKMNHSLFRRTLMVKMHPNIRPYNHQEIQRLYVTCRYLCFLSW